MSEAVLDASALLALLNAEPGSEVVEATIPGAAISAVNLSEVVAKLADRGLPEAAIREVLGDVEMALYTFDAAAAHQAGQLRRETRHLGLSFGDRACVALGRQLGLPVLTADGNWEALDVGVEVQLIR